jgi:Kef-type K+ transport system membrane component KefB
MLLLEINLNRIKEWLQHYFPLTNPVLIFSVVLLIILFAPLIFRRFKIPGIIGLIIAGVIIGPHSLHVIEKSSFTDIFATIGKLYIMFLAGVEIDMQEYKRNQKNSFLFGFMTFIIPLGLGMLVCLEFFGFSFWPSLLISSMFSTHTLLSYPIVSSMGITRTRAVQVAIGGTIITDTAVLILLGVIVKISEGTLNARFWLFLVLSLSAFVLFTLYLIPKITRWFFRRFEGQSSQYVYVLAVIFICAFLAEMSGAETIIGAFLAGLALNRVIPHNSILMNRTIFIGNTLFIPFFLISAGMIVDLSVLFNGWKAIVFALVLSTVALITKYTAAMVTRFAGGYTRAEGNLLFGLSASHAAATLVVITVGQKIFPEVDQNVYNGTIILILITCMVSSFVTERAARKIAIAEKDVNLKIKEKPERILVPMANPENMQRLIDFALLIKNPASAEPIYPLSIVEDANDADEKLKLIRQATEGIVEQISSGDKQVEILKKVDLNIVDGIVRTAKAYSISDIIINWRGGSGANFLFGNITENLVGKSSQQIFASRILQPMNSFDKCVVLLTPNAELENAFKRSALKINTIIRQVGNETRIYGNSDTLEAFKRVIGDKKSEMHLYAALEDFSDLSFIEQNMKQDDLHIFLCGRPQTVSFEYHVDQLPKIISKSREFSSFIVIYPEIASADQGGFNTLNEITASPLVENIDKIIKIKDKLKGIFNKEKK